MKRFLILIEIILITLGGMAVAYFDALYKDNIEQISYQEQSRQMAIQETEELEKAIDDLNSEIEELEKKEEISQYLLWKRRLEELQDRLS
ncbi:MAG: hypothetical protein IJI92_02055 [Erysipelotrichaceae bacterium]|nr:hypothetical protein [Erysipelotrichaceae bacterium]